MSSQGSSSSNSLPSSRLLLPGGASQPGSPGAPVKHILLQVLLPLSAAVLLLLLLSYTLLLPMLHHCCRSQVPRHPTSASCC